MNLCPLALKQADTVPMIITLVFLHLCCLGNLFRYTRLHRTINWSSLETLFPSIHLETMKLLCSIILQYYCNAYTVSSCCLLHYLTLTCIRILDLHAVFNAHPIVDLSDRRPIWLNVQNYLCITLGSGRAVLFTVGLRGTNF